MKDRLLSIVMLSVVGLLQNAFAQTVEPCVSGNRPAFDVVSVKPSDRPETSWMRRTPDGLTMTAPLRTVIQLAFSLHDFQVTGGPDWIKTTNWEIRAKSDDPADLLHLDDAQRQAVYDKNMQELQSMLMDRFRMQCHMSSKQMPVYDLVTAKAGLKLKESRSSVGQRGEIQTSSYGLAQHASGTAVGMNRIAILLAGPTGRTVIDKTGLSGSYDFTLDWVSDAQGGSQATGDSPAGSSIYTAVEEQLGLKLVPAHDEVPVLLIDKVELPSQD